MQTLYAKQICNKKPYTTIIQWNAVDKVDIHAKTQESQYTANKAYQSDQQQWKSVKNM